MHYYCLELFFQYIIYKKLHTNEILSFKEYKKANLLFSFFYMTQISIKRRVEKIINLSYFLDLVILYI